MADYRPQSTFRNRRKANFLEFIEIHPTAARGQNRKLESTKEECTDQYRDHTRTASRWKSIRTCQKKHYIQMEWQRAVMVFIPKQQKVSDISDFIKMLIWEDLHPGQEDNTNWRNRCGGLAFFGVWSFRSLWFNSIL